MSDLVGKRVHLDANVLIYALESLPPWNQMAQAVVNLGDTGQSEIFTSELSLAECLVKPFQTGNNVLEGVYMTSLRNRSGLFVVGVSRRLPVEAARVRAMVQTCKMPDAIHLATAKRFNCDVFLTNDARLKNVQVGPTIELLSSLTT